MKNRPLLIAHRGYSGKAPENTLAAFKAAIAAGAQMIELDVHLSRDGQIVVAHDFELGRCCKAEGRISSYSAEELRKLDAGAWFGPGFRGERIPLLEEALALAKGKAELNIELKEETATTPEGAAALASGCLRLASEAGMEKQVVFSSFDWALLGRLRSLNPLARLGLLNHEPDTSLRWEAAASLSPYSYHPNHLRLSAALAEEIRSRGLKLFPYTANSRSEFQRLLELGADGIITNEVEALARFLEQS